MPFHKILYEFIFNKTCHSTIHCKNLYLIKQIIKKKQKQNKKQKKKKQGGRGLIHQRAFICLHSIY